MVKAAVIALDFLGMVPQAVANRLALLIMVVFAVIPIGFMGMDVRSR